MSLFNLFLYDTYGFEGTIAIHFWLFLIAIFGLCIYWICKACEAEKKHKDWYEIVYESGKRKEKRW